MKELEFLSTLMARYNEVLADPEWEWDAMVEAAHDMADDIEQRMAELDAGATMA